MNLLSCSLKRLCKKHQSSEKVLKTRKNRLNFEVERKPTGFYCKMATNFGSITIDGMGKEFIQIQIFISNLGVTCIDVEHNSILKRIAHSLFFLRWNKIYFKVIQVFVFCNSGLWYLYLAPILHTPFLSKVYRFRKSSFFSCIQCSWKNTQIWVSSV